MAKARPFVKPDFVPPPPPEEPMFALEQLTVAHNEADLDAWSTSVDHIRATPGFGAMDWPDEPMTLARNELDLRQHEVDFANRAGFTYSVVNRPGGRVIGCVYIYPPTRPGVDADVRSWVRASHAELDTPLYEAVTFWLQTQWPFKSFDYAARY